MPKLLAPLTLAVGLALCVTLVAGCSDGKPSAQVLERSRTTPDWYDDAKLGIFIHWGPAAVPAFAEGEPLRPGELEEMLLHDSGRQQLPYADWYLYSLGLAGSATALHHAQKYGDAPYEAFGPEFEKRVNTGWDPAAWADFFADSGARYVVLVSKHHDGYTLWPSDVPNPNRQGWGSSRDLVADLAAAVRERGMRFGVYYSTGLDWTFDLVTEGDLVRDMIRSAPAGEAYANYAHAQLRELIDRYRPDVLWADIAYPTRGRLGELLAYYFAEVPQGTVNDRWGELDNFSGFAEIPGSGTVMKALARWLTANADPLADDPARIGFKTAEYDSLPGTAPFKWEATRGLGGSFAFNERETAADMLSAAELVNFVVDTVAKNGNVLINVGPDSYGRMPAIQQAPLRGLGEWLAVNGEAIYGTRPWQRFGNLEGRELRYTSSPSALYAIVSGPVGDAFTIEHPGVEWSGIAVLGGELDSVVEEGDMLTFTLAAPLTAPATVVRFTR